MTNHYYFVQINKKHFVCCIGMNHCTRASPFDAFNSVRDLLLWRIYSWVLELCLISRDAPPLMQQHGKNVTTVFTNCKARNYFSDKDASTSVIDDSSISTGTTLAAEERLISNGSGKATDSLTRIKICSFPRQQEPLSRIESLLTCRLGVSRNKDFEVRDISMKES